MHRGTIGLRPALRDEQRERPAGECSGCGGEVYPGERVYRWEGQWLCVDCFVWQVRQLLAAAPSEVADGLGVEHRKVDEDGQG